MPPVIYIQERKKLDPQFLPKPVAKDYTGARAYLGLLMPDDRADKAIGILKKSPVVQFRAADLVRASRLGLIDKKDPGVQKASDKLESGDPLSPVLLIQGTDDPDANMIIADGAHRVSAAYWLDPDITIPAVLAKGVFDD